MSEVYMHQLKPGNIFNCMLVVDPGDLAYPESQTESTRKIKDREPVPRNCIVLTPGEHSVEVTYTATFAYREGTLPEGLSKDMWYPIKPAKQEGDFEPLPRRNNHAQWVSLRKKHVIISDGKKIRKFRESLSKDSVDAIKAAMKG